jgi:carboxypeptidase Q
MAFHTLRSLMKKLFPFLLSFLFISNIHAQDNDSIVIKKIFSEALSNSRGYYWLEELVNKIGGRLSGSPEAAMAVEWTKKKMMDAGADTVILQPVMVPHWVRGEKEVGRIMDKSNTQAVPVCALGNSIATPKEGITATVIEVRDFDELKNLGEEKIKGKIVFYNHPFDQSHYTTFRSYGETGRYRWAGASEAARYGAVASITRSLAQNDDDYPHTGSMGYNDSLPKIPCAAISTNGANLLSKTIKANPQTKFFLKMSCVMLDSVLSYNVVGVLKGSEHPNELIAVGGHLDSWETGKGAHDDGAGVIHSIEVIRLFKTLGIKPNRTIRAVAFMNEENGLRGGRKYAELAKQNNENHIAAIESDAGGFTPFGFGLDMDDEKRKKIQAWKPLFIPYNVWNFDQQYGGADIGPLHEQGVPCLGLSVDSQRYFDYHHAASDTFDKVNRRELELGAAAMAALVYMLQQYGL